MVRNINYTQKAANWLVPLLHLSLSQVTIYFTFTNSTNSCLYVEHTSHEPLIESTSHLEYLLN